MKKLIPFLPVLLIALTACPKKDHIDQPDNTSAVVSQFVYDGLSTYYLWSDLMVNKKPTAADNTDPKAYFESVLSPIDKEHGWSWITSDIDALFAEFAGTPKDFGWSLNFLKVSDKNYVAVVKYVFPHTPAALAGITRGNIIDKIGGAVITSSNVGQLFETNTISINVNDQNFANARTVSLTPVTIQTNPVLADSVYKNKPEFAGRKIGYLFYTDFIEGFNPQLYNTFADFKAEGITDLVVDLRYNHGGAMNAAIYLASLIAPRAAVENKKPFTQLTYNSFLNGIFESSGGLPTDSLGVVGGITPLNANLNLNKVYIIATDDSYSAAELLTFCLRPYMQVVHIGSKTGGKFTASITIHAYNDYDNRAATVYNSNTLSNEQKNSLKNWAMQPIVAKYADAAGRDFEKPGYLIPDIPVTSIENQPSAWKPIGSTDDYLLARAIAEITGLSVPASARVSTAPRSVYKFSNAKIFSPMDNRLKESVHLAPPAVRPAGSF
ncbi:S41 family peptidase [Niabella aquatica]